MSGLKRIVMHWTGGTHECSDLDREHYHFIVDGRGEIHEGKFRPEDNAKCVKGKYAAHTKGLNTGSIGVAIAAMAGAEEKNPWWTKYPPTKIQVERFCRKIAELCEAHGIDVSPKTVVNHGEVEAVLGVAQNGKWDINRLPWPVVPFESAGDWLRAKVRSYMKKKEAA